MFSNIRKLVLMHGHMLPECSLVEAHFILPRMHTYTVSETSFLLPQCSFFILPSSLFIVFPLSTSFGVLLFLSLSLSLPHILCLALVPACVTSSALLFPNSLIIKGGVGRLPTKRVLHHGVCAGACVCKREREMEEKLDFNGRPKGCREKVGGKFSLKSCDPPVSP